MFRYLSTSFSLFVLAIPLSASGTLSDTQPTHPDQLRRVDVRPLDVDAVTAVPVGKANRIVVYSATWCAPCQRLKPVIASLKKEGYKVVYRDIDKDAEKLDYAYQAVPTIFFVRGKEVIKKETGYRSKAHIKKTLVLEPELAMSRRDWN